MKYWNKKLSVSRNFNLIIHFVIRWIFATLLMIPLTIIYLSLVVLNSGLLLCFGKDKLHQDFHDKINDNIELWEQKYNL